MVRRARANTQGIRIGSIESRRGYMEWEERPKWGRANVVWNGGEGSRLLFKWAAAERKRGSTGRDRGRRPEKFCSTTTARPHQQAVNGGMGTSAATIAVCLSLLSSALLGRAAIFNVVSFGAVGDGKTDNSKAFQRAWSAACLDTQSSALFFVPSPGTFLLATHVSFSGPCRTSKILVQVAGDVVAPRGVWTSDLTNAWITFKYISGLSIYGTGKFDGQGFDWWTCRTSHLLSVAFCDGFHLSGLTFANSPGKHLTLFASQWVVIRGITVTAPWDSLNTDGILIAYSKHVQLMASSFATGDDCVAIGTGSSDVNVSQITCGPGHGISIGSLGMNGARAEVENVRVTDSHISHTLFGVRIKTWSGGSGFARGILYENITMRSVVFPILIDQYYCGGATGCPNKTSNVEVSNVQFVGLVGTTTSDRAIRLECSQSVPCRDILLDHVVLAPADRRKTTASTCYNVQGREIGPVIPTAPCL